MFPITLLAACSDYELNPIKEGENPPAQAEPTDTGTDDPPVIVVEDTGDAFVPEEDTASSPPLDTGGDIPEGDTIPTTKEYIVETCVAHVSPDHCPLNSDWSEIPECRAGLDYDAAAVDALIESAAGLTIFATMDTDPGDADSARLAYLHISEGDNRETVLAEFAKDIEEEGYAGRMSMHRFVAVPQVDCFAHDFPLNRRRIDLDPAVELENDGYVYDEARLRWSNTLGAYSYASIRHAVATESFPVEDGYIIYGTEMMVDNNNDALYRLIKMLTADDGVAEETYGSLSRWTAIKYVP